MKDFFDLLKLSRCSMYDVSSTGEMLEIQQRATKFQRSCQKDCVASKMRFMQNNILTDNRKKKSVENPRISSHQKKSFFSRHLSYFRHRASVVEGCEAAQHTRRHVDSHFVIHSNSLTLSHLPHHVVHISCS